MEDYPRDQMEFDRRFATEQACREYLFQLRWPDGFTCPKCEGRKAWPRQRGLWLCAGCGYEVSVLVGTVFQESRLPLTVWFRAMWLISSQKTGASAMGLQRVLGLGSYRTAWTLLHKLRRAMIRPGRERLSGVIEVDETYWGGEEEGRQGRKALKKQLIAVAAQEDGPGIGRVRLRTIEDASAKSLHGFIAGAIEPGSRVCTDGWTGYASIERLGYQHSIRPLYGEKGAAERLLPRVHRVISLLKRWILGTHQGSVGAEHLDDYLNEFTFRFNRRKSQHRGKLFYRLAQQAVLVPPHPYSAIVKVPGRRTLIHHQ